jgi:hypothetical protein
MAMGGGLCGCTETCSVPMFGGTPALNLALTGWGLFLVSLSGRSRKSGQPLYFKLCCPFLHKAHVGMKSGLCLFSHCHEQCSSAQWVLAGGT